MIPWLRCRPLIFASRSQFAVRNPGRKEQKRQSEREEDGCMDGEREDLKEEGEDQNDFQNCLRLQTLPHPLPLPFSL